ncbi:carbonic anhydrase 4-like isoform X2 [Echeneis naucrates]|uniref:carbonic anhydrase 4-like isoform X2 n=1 Tax=Echeneis naucrates TaxID=173247 RepID=UPI0011133ECA|nr:carbonic anhydrase 4-like isoform X2 [Echeneis naucrates]
MFCSSLLFCVGLGTLAKYAVGSDLWCYNEHCESNPSHWADLAGSFCGGSKQSPINIKTNHAEKDNSLTDFMFVNFSSNQVIQSIQNNGHTVKCNLKKNQVEVSGGGLDGTYYALQFHFHWGKLGDRHSGSEHTLDGERLPMEMHIVTMKKGLDVEEAKKDPQGFAVLAFFINETENGDVSGPWEKLTSNVPNDQVTEEPKLDISINDLIGDVNLSMFYRYMGSFTTPDCNEAVAWTVFREPIKVNKKLIERFPSKAGFNNVFRPVQNLAGRQVFASPATPLPPTGPWCYGDDDDDPHHHQCHTVKCSLKEGEVEVSGGGLGHVYSTLQFHFHWGDTSGTPGSEHAVDSKKYPMEMHIVNKRKDLSLANAIKTPNGLAVLGFFIEATTSTKSSSSSSDAETHPSPSSDNGAWEKLTNHLSAIKSIKTVVNVTEGISIDDLLGSVNRRAYYRYNGSLTTPSCNEAVVWTVFKETVKVDKKLMDMFPSQMEYSKVNRPKQDLHGRTVYRTTSASGAPGPVMLFLLPASLAAFLFKCHL